VVLQQLGDGRILMTQTQLAPRQTDLGQPGAERDLAGDKPGAIRGAALLGVEVGEQSAPDHEDVGFLLCPGRRTKNSARDQAQQQPGHSCQILVHS